MSQSHLSEQEQIRRDSLEEIQKAGIKPFPAPEYKVNFKSNELINLISDIEKFSNFIKSIDLKQLKKYNLKKNKYFKKYVELKEYKSCKSKKNILEIWEVIESLKDFQGNTLTILRNLFHLIPD
jgi:chromatin remodeling complex protein RSC6